MDGLSAEQIAQRRIILDGHLQIPAGDADVAVPRGITDLGQRAAAGQGVADEGVALRSL